MLDESALFQRADQLRRIFFYRICGMGMAPAACLLKEKGLEVEGFDLHLGPPLATMLHSAQIECHNTVTEQLLQSFDLVVVGNVLPRQSAEARMIEQSGVPFCSFPAALGAFVLRDREVVGICGTHGKTTTSYFATQLFEILGERPGYFIGGVLEDRSPANLGTEDIFFIESDEYDSAYFHKISKFRSYHLNSMVLTSLEFDHADIFSSLEEIIDQFRPVVKDLDGVVIANEQYPIIREFMETRKVIWYGGAFPRVIEETPQGTHFQLQWREKILSFQTNVLGKHNIDNLSAVILYALHKGHSHEKIAGVLESLKRARRRQELRGYYRGCPVIDDFAHHPRAVQLTINAIKASYPDRKIHVIFEPASATARSSVFQQEFSESFVGASSIFILRPNKPTTVKNFGNINWEQLCKDLQHKGQSVVTNGDGLKEMLLFIESNMQNLGLLLVLSNGQCGGLWESDFVEQLKHE